MGYGSRISSDIKIIQIDQDYSNVGKNRDIDIGLVGHPGSVLSQIIDLMPKSYDTKIEKSRDKWIELLSSKEDEKYEKLLPTFKSDSMPIHPYRVAYEINEFLDHNTIFIGDGGDVVWFTEEKIFANCFCEGVRLIGNPNGFACLGIENPCTRV